MLLYVSLDTLCYGIWDLNYMFALTTKVSLLGKSITAGSHLPRMLCNTAPEATGTTSHVELMAIWLFSSKIGLTQM